MSNPLHSSHVYLMGTYHSIEQGIHPQNTAQLLTQLYETSDATFRTLAQDIQFTHAGYPILEAISNLYLNKQIAFEKL